jgi:hypothetical protein
MSPPTRLRDDPAFIRETGCDLSAEADALAPPDLAVLRARVHGGIRLARLRRGLAAGGGVAVAVVAAAHLFWPVEPDPLVAPVPEVVATVAPPPPAATYAPTPVPPVPPPRARAAPRGAASSPAASPAAVATLPEAPPVVTPEPEPAPRPAGDLAAQHAAFEAAENALVDGDGAAARAAYADYLARWPAGAFAPEARVGELHAEILVGDDAEAAALAAVLADDPAFLARRAELLAVRAGALARLGRCAEALALVPELARSDAASVRRSCR